PGSLQEQGLVQALNDYSLLFGAQEHILVYLDVQGGDKHLPPAVAEALYRVTQEALHNIARHAQATRVDVNLISLPERVELTIEDNGVGFDPNGTRQGLGLTNMQERLMTVGGKLTVESQPGIGTKVTAEVALPYLPTMLTAMTAARRERPSLSVSNWAWLGQRLVIPVGQTWPWLPADQRHLRDPLIDPDDTPVRVQEHKGLLQLRKEYRLQPTVAIAPLARLQQSGAGYEWHINSERWTLQRIRGRAGRMVLNRNNQPLAAMQYQGRQMHVWTEIVYDDRAYRLVSCKEGECAMLLEDDSGEILIEIRQKNGLTLTLKRPLPLPFLVIVAVRVIDERVRGSLMIETEG
ncbi:MAG: hypothetical protein JXB35_07905, partial [Anaerolineae bacterium]|nr:hypothetical protein [Anaerolineae bacterium]